MRCASPPRQRVGAAVQAQVVQADVVEELQPRADLAHHLVGDLGLGAVQVQAPRSRPGTRAAWSARLRRSARARRSAGVDQEDVARLAPQARAVAVGAGLGALVARQVLAHRDRVGLAEAPLEVRHDAFERMLRLTLRRPAARAFGLVDELDLLAARAVQQHLRARFGQLLERRVDVEAVVAGDALEQREGVGVAPVPALDRAAGQAERREGDHALGVEHRHQAEAVAARAGADRRVEREQARLELGAASSCRPGRRTCSLNRCSRGARSPRRRRWRPARARARGRRRCAARPRSSRPGAAAMSGLHLDAVDHDVDVVLLGLLQLRHVGRLDRRAVDAKAHVALRLHVGEQLGELALAVAHHRRQHHQPRVVGQREHRVDHLAHALRLQRQVVVGAERRAGAGVEQAQVVVDLGDRADGRARVVRGRLLLDADRRATGPRSRRRRACPSAAGTGARRPTGSRRSGAGPSAYSVSKARLDLPEPDSPVITTSRLRGMSRSMFFRLCVRAPRTRIKAAPTAERAAQLAEVAAGVAGSRRAPGRCRGEPGAGPRLRPSAASGTERRKRLDGGHRRREKANRA